MRKEQGGGGVTYALYFLVIVMVFIFCKLIITKSNIEMGYQEMRQKLYIAESSVLTITKCGVFSENGKGNPLSNVNMAMIVVLDKNGQSTTEGNQIDAIGVALSNKIKNDFCLNGTTNFPSKGALSIACDKRDSRGLLIDKVSIYQPYYELVINTSTFDAIKAKEIANKMKAYNEATNQAVKDSILEDIKVLMGGSGNFENSISRNMKGWKSYTLTFDDHNNYVSYSTSTSASAPYLFDGALINGTTKQANGSTIEVTLSATLLNMPNIISTDPSEKVIFKSVSQDSYRVTLTRAMDIVYADADDRQQ